MKYIGSEAIKKQAKLSEEERLNRIKYKRFNVKTAQYENLFGEKEETPEIYEEPSLPLKPRRPKTKERVKSYSARKSKVEVERPEPLPENPSTNDIIEYNKKILPYILTYKKEKWTKPILSKLA